MYNYNNSFNKGSSPSRKLVTLKSNGIFQSKANRSQSFEVSSGWDCYWLYIWPLWQDSRINKDPVSCRQQTLLSTVQFLKWWRIPKPFKRIKWASKSRSCQRWSLHSEYGSPELQKEKVKAKQPCSFQFSALAKNSTQLRALQILRQLHTKLQTTRSQNQQCFPLPLLVTPGS